MKKLLIVVVLLGLLLAASMPIKLVRLTVVNKSGYEASIKLEGLFDEIVWQVNSNEKIKQVYQSTTPLLYYLHPIPVGDRDAPTLKVWTIVPDWYDASVDYFTNGLLFYSTSEKLDLTHRSKITLLPPAKSGIELCEDKFDKNTKEFNQCVEDLVYFGIFGEFYYKFNPSMWLTRWQY